MPERLCSVGLDVGTTSTQLIVSRLEIRNLSGSFSVPEMEITRREILYRSPVHFTPLLGEDLVDAAALRALVEAEYRNAGIRREDVDTGAIIITGETSRRENAGAVLRELSGFAGDFVVTTAGPDLESVLAAKGAGAVRYSGDTGKTVLHMDIGGGTSNLALIRDGQIVATGCLNVGGRLLKMERKGKTVYVSPVLSGICPAQVGGHMTREDVLAVADTLVQALEMAAGLRERTELLEKLWTKESKELARWCSCIGKGENMVISFSGGVADCIENRQDWLTFGDMGPILGQAIRESRLCRGQYVLGKETIRATVIGAGCHSAQLSGSTVYHRNITFPLKNLPVIAVDVPAPEILRRELEKQEETAILTLKGLQLPGYEALTHLARDLLLGFGDRPILICLEPDLAKALGQALAVRAKENTPILCIDRVRLREESYLDIGAPVGPALPVVVKTLVLER